MTAPPDSPEGQVPPESFASFLESSRAGYVYADPDGAIISVNGQVAKWLGASPAQLAGTSVFDLFSIAGKIYFQTHLTPLLKMQGFFEEVALELAPANAPRVPVIASGVERVDAGGAPQFLCLTLLRTVERRQYERNLAAAKSAAIAERLKIQGDLSDERQSALLREQFIAVLGHDLRNPLAAIDGAMSLLRKTPLNERAQSIVEMVLLSVGRMSGLIDNVMDFARGRLGKGIEIRPEPTNLLPILQHAIEELRVAWPNRHIETSFTLAAPVRCDGSRIAQLLSNLLANALTHGAAEGAIRVRAATENGMFELCVCNEGEPIAPAALERLFLPFTREDLRPSQQGLGLGLYIASEIAKAHQGSLTVHSTSEETTFTLLIPMA